MYDVVSRKDRKVFRKGREWILSHNESLYVFSVSLCALRVKNSSSLFLAKNRKVFRKGCEWFFFHFELQYVYRVY